MKRLAILVLSALSLSSCELLKSSTGPSPVPDDQVNYTAIGASDALGIGGSVQCFPFVACPNGTGYVQRLVRKFEADGKTVTLMNLGIPGAVLSPEIEAIGASIGRSIPGNFLERELPFVPRDSTLVTILAGANDVNTVAAAMREGAGADNRDAYIAERVTNFGRDVRALVDGVRDRAPGVRIVVLNLPNLAGMPYAGGYSSGERSWLRQLAVGFSAETNTLASTGALVVDLMCNATIYNSGYFSADGFHPNDAGYEHLANLVHAAVKADTASAPSGSCPQMNYGS